MKSFTAIYDTAKYSNIGYSFEAKDMESAQLFCEQKFNVPVKQIIEN